MKRERATTLLEDMLLRPDVGTDWLLTLVDELYLFGSYARTARRRYRRRLPPRRADSEDPAFTTMDSSGEGSGA